MDAHRESAWSSCRKQRVFFSVAPDPADADVDPMRLLERMLHVVEGSVLPCLQIVLQFVFDAVEHGRTAAVVVEAAESGETLLLEETQPIGDGVPADATESGDLAVLLAEILEFNAQEAPENLRIALMLLEYTKFFVLGGRELYVKSHEEKREDDLIVGFEIIKSN